VSTTDIPTIGHKSADDFDLVVIGSGPAGQKGAIAAAKLHKRVAIIDRNEMIGGCSLHLGTIPSKTFREAILYLSGIRQRSFYGASYTVKDTIVAADLVSRVRMVLARETEVIRHQLHRNGVVTIDGTARFIDPHTVEVESSSGVRRIHGAHILIACGTRPAENPAIPTDGRRIFNSDQLLELDEIPHELIVVGGGVVGLEYASMFAALNTRVTLIDQRPTLLDFADREIIEALSYHLRSQGVTFRLGEEVSSVITIPDGRVEARLESGKIVHADSLLYAVGRQANTDLLSLETTGVRVDPRGRIAVNTQYQTEVPHIYAAGDVVGFPALAASSMEQGRLASAHMFGTPGMLVADHMPYGIYTIPEISMVGQCEQTLTARKIRYEVGISKFCELAKGQMIGDDIGLLKLLFDPESHRLLGVHVIGDSATEIVHIGQAVLALGGTIDYFRDAMFNYPTLAEAYKVAALNGLNKL
jgi:NAD(P) transhydrogenase